LDIPARLAALDSERRVLCAQATEALVIAIAEAIGHHVFGADDVMRHARLLSPPLQHALQQAGVASARQLGKFLRHWHRHPVRGLALERVDRDSAGIVWAVSVRDLHHEAGVGGGDGA
jgi:hypothetical protein